MKSKLVVIACCLTLTVKPKETCLDEQGERHWVFRRQSRFHLVW